MVEGVSMLFALIAALFFQGEDIVPILQCSSLISIAVGGITVVSTWNAKRSLSKNDGFVIVSLVWIVFSFFGSLPYLLSGSIPTLTDAFFETMSGFTTTGSSILNDIESLPHGILFWRSMTQWLGLNGNNCIIVGNFTCIWDRGHAAICG